MQMKWIEPSTLWSARFRKAVRQEGGELGPRHLARGHGELAVLDLAGVPDMAVDRHVVGRIGEHHPGLSRPSIRTVDHLRDRAHRRRSDGGGPSCQTSPGAHARAALSSGRTSSAGSPGSSGASAVDEAVDLGNREAGDADDRSRDRLSSSAPSSSASSSSSQPALSASLLSAST